MSENDREIINHLSEKYPNSYGILQYSLIDAIQANDIPLVERVAYRLSSYVPIRWNGLYSANPLMTTILEDKFNRSTTPTSIQNIDLRPYDIWFNDMNDEMDRYYAIGRHELLDGVVRFALDSKTYELYQKLRESPDLYGRLEYPIEIKYDPLDIIYEFVDTDLFLKNLSNASIISILMNNPIINRISLKIADSLSRGRDVPQLLATSIILGLVELVDKYANRDNIIAAYANITLEPLRSVHLDKYPFIPNMMRLLQLKGLHPEWYIYSIDGSNVERVPLDFWKKLLANAIGYRNILLVRNMIESGSSRIKREDITQHILDNLSRSNLQHQVDMRYLL